MKKIGVVGCGLMGSGIAEVVARAGFDVVVRETSDALIEAGRRRISESLDRGVAKEKMTPTDRGAALERIRFATSLEDLADADLVIEAIVEDLMVKNQLFAELDRVCAAKTILASNTSSLAITDLASATKRADRFVGLHFFNPAPVMKLVEVVRTLATSGEVVARTIELVRALGKTPIVVRDASGFVVNLLLVPFMLDAIRQLERGVAGVEEIDAAMVLGAGHPMGPFRLCDFVGIDTLLRISEIMFEEYRETRYAPPPLLRRMVSLGRLGRKSGMGFYDWSSAEPVPLRY